MLIPDLKELSSGRNPSPYGAPVLIRRAGKSGHGLLPIGTVLRAVGWLGSDVPTCGATRPECLDKLLVAYEAELVFRHGGLGPHGCEICTGDVTDKAEVLRRCAPIVHWRGRDVQLYGHGHYLVRRQDIVYMTPALVLHYILGHGYRPPDEFVEAVMEGSFLRDDDLEFVP